MAGHRHRDDELLAAFGQAVRIARTRKGLSQRELAVLGDPPIDRALLGRIELGRHDPGLGLVARIAKALGMTFPQLMEATSQELRQREAGKRLEHRETPARAATLTEVVSIVPVVQPLALAVIVQDGLLLMTRRRFPEQIIDAVLDWNLISGKINPGETPEEAAVRETGEEVGLLVEAVARIFDHPHPKNPDGRHFYYIGCTIIRGAPELVDHEENREFHWATLEQADERVSAYGGFAPPVRAWIEQAMARTRT